MNAPTSPPIDPDLIPGMPYRHYKGGQYTIVGAGRLEHDLLPAVVYRADRDPSSLWVRTTEVFLETVDTPAGAVPRFAPAWPDALRCLDAIPRATVLRVLAHYDEPYRRYHDRRHVMEIFAVAAARGIALSLPQALAVLFHDAVYVPGSPHNEAASAQLIDAYIDNVDPAVTALAARIVNDTAGHTPSTADAEVVLDLDLYRLAADDATFDAYGQAIFEENRGVLRRLPGVSADTLWPTYLARRAGFLRELAQRERLFLTPAFADCEAPARRNLARAIAAG
jgi:predicted metal-dependent HD superfamily phosphohydrolase